MLSSKAGCVGLSESGGKSGDKQVVLVWLSLELVKIFDMMMASLVGCFCSVLNMSDALMRAECIWRVVRMHGSVS